MRLSQRDTEVIEDSVGRSVAKMAVELRYLRWAIPAAQHRSLDCFEPPGGRRSQNEENAAPRLVAGASVNAARCGSWRRSAARKERRGM